MDLSVSVGLADYAGHVGALFAIVNPFSTVPVLLSVVREGSGRPRGQPGSC